MPPSPLQRKTRFKDLFTERKKLFRALLVQCSSLRPCNYTSVGAKSCRSRILKMRLKNSQHVDMGCRRKWTIKTFNKVGIEITGYCALDCFFFFLSLNPLSWIVLLVTYQRKDFIHWLFNLQISFNTSVFPTLNLRLGVMMAIKFVARFKSIHEEVWGFAPLRCSLFFCCSDAVNKIPLCDIAVIWNFAMCDVGVFHPTVLGKNKLFAVLWFIVWPSSGYKFSMQTSWVKINYLRCCGFLFDLSPDINLACKVRG